MPSNLNAQTTDLRHTFPATGGSHSHHYTYTPAGSPLSRSEGDGGVNSFTYDGMGQIISEVRTGPVPFIHSYTYDYNGNWLTQTVNGTLTQSFTYDAHDKLTGGINESESYDPNGNLTVQTVSGQTTRFGWDDEDRLTSQTFADGHSDLYGYTGLGMRLTKADPTGGYSYLADGVSPASPVLSDGRTSFTPGVSETHGTGNGTYASVFYLADASGNSRGLLDGGQGNTDGYNWDAFGNPVSRAGTNPTAYAWNEESGYQTDADSGLKLLGHRYYDSRTGRFISQDPAGDGDNWYGYADNDPMDEVDPDGLSASPNPSAWSPYGSTQADGNWAVGNVQGDALSSYSTMAQTVHLFLLGGHQNQSGNVQWDWAMPLESWMIAGPQNRGGGRLSPNEADRANEISSHMERLRRLALKKTGQAYEDKLKLPGHHPDELTNPSKSRYGHRVRLQRQIKAPWNALRSELKEILERAGVAGAAALDDLTIDLTGFGYFDPTLIYQKSYRGIDVTPHA